uniref:protein-tyrosine-phosphatase n=1 Tax=Panagrellus redivivus TaxID=6233 RepID=A0A7E4VZT5_PANRE
MGDISRQWWVANKRYELVKPFYMLSISPLLAEDAGTFRCRLETDPLFALAVSTDATSVVVMVKPPPPSKPQVTSFTEKSVTLSWGHSVAMAHKPILRYSILISQLDDENIRVVSTKSNATTALISSLQPYTRYAFSVRGENSAGHSNFGPEVVFRTMGEAPTSAPILIGIRNGSDGCVDVEWRAPTSSNGQIVGYRIMVHKLGNGAMREWYLKGNRQSLCSLSYYSEFMLSIEADNGFGYSPAASRKFATDVNTPDGPPEMIQLRTLRFDAVMVSWHEPLVPNGPITTYTIYYKEAKNPRDPVMIPLKVQTNDPSKSFSFNVTRLKAFTHYKFMISASTAAGEGPKSSVMHVTTDHSVPAMPQIMNISYDCNKDVTVYWTSLSAPVSFYRVMVQINENPASYNTTEQKMVFPVSMNNRYTVQVSAVLRSVYDNNTFLESNFSKSEVFQIKDKCHLQSSICSTFNHNCVPITNRPNNADSSSLSFTLIFLGLLFVICGAVFFFCVVKKQCIFVKQYLKKTDQKYPQESLSLVYDTNEPISGETITVGHFEKYYNEMTANDNELFKQQFEEIEAETAHIVLETDESIEENKLKNRYLNIGAVESTRIRIHGTNSDYINANYIDSCDAKNFYIATQAPLPHTFNDFWAMVQQEKSNIVVVITNMVERGRRKCDQYWPVTLNSPTNFGGFQVTLTSELPNANFIHRIFTLKSTNSITPERTIHQVHFTSWPDHGVPKSVFPLLSFMNYVSEIQSTGPIVVHCSAGVGRSGSYILIDSMRRHLLQCDRINVYAHLKHIRKQRAKLVQTDEQYVFCHDVIRELIRHGISRQPVLNFSYYVNFLYTQQMPDGRTRLQMQYEDVCKCPHSKPCEPEVGCVVLPGYHRPNEFLVGNWPEACEELWSSLWEHNCQTMLLIGNDIDLANYFGKYFPIKNESSVPPEDENIRVERRDDNNFWLYNKEDELCVKLICIRPSSFEVDFWGAMERIQEEVLQYHNCQMMLIDPSSSATAYILCTLQSAACQMEAERYVDVLPFISTYRYVRCGCWKSQNNLEYIYDKLTQLAVLQHRH